MSLLCLVEIAEQCGVPWPEQTSGTSLVALQTSSYQQQQGPEMPEHC